MSGHECIPKAFVGFHSILPGRTYSIGGTIDLQTTPFDSIRDIGGPEIQPKPVIELLWES